MALVKVFHGDKSKITACAIIKLNQENRENWRHDEVEKFKSEIIEPMEYTLPTRLADESFQGMMNIEKMIIPDTTIVEIEKALVS